MSDQQATKPLSKRKQIVAALQDYHGTQVSEPNAKQILIFKAHVMCANSEYQPFSKLIGMYAGYWIIGTTDQDYPFMACRFYNKIFTHQNYKTIDPPTNGFWVQHEPDGTYYQEGKHSHIRYGKTLDLCLAAVLDQIAYNAGGRSANKGLWQRRLPQDLQIQPHARSNWARYGSSVTLEDFYNF
jgi:hypothetical protein